MRYLSITNPVMVFKDLQGADALMKIRKALRKRSGIYSFINTVNNMQYIGSSADLGSRFNEHLNGRKSNIHLQRAITKHGIGNFIFVIYEFQPYVLPDILNLETDYILYFPPLMLYNILLSATSPFGTKHTPEAIAKMVAHLSDKTNHPQ
jgi:group I intron endonuclease